MFGFSILVHSGHMTQPRQFLPSYYAAQLHLSCSFPDCLVWYFIHPWDIQYPSQPSVMRRLESPADYYCDQPCLGPYSRVLSCVRLAGPCCLWLSYNHCFSISFQITQIQHLLCHTCFDFLVTAAVWWHHAPEIAEVFHLLNRHLFCHNPVIFLFSRLLSCLGSFIHSFIHSFWPFL